MGLTGGTWSVGLIGGTWTVGLIGGTWVGLGHHQTQFVEPVPHVECRLIKYS